MHFEILNAAKFEIVVVFQHFLLRKFKTSNELAFFQIVKW